VGDRLQTIGAWLAGALFGLMALLVWGTIWLVVALAFLDIFGVIHLDTDESKPVRARVERSVTPTCDPNYTGCVPDSPYDVDCDEVAGPVEVIGSDVDGLDADSDGIGCEWG